jgi:exonuclease III
MATGACERLIGKIRIRVATWNIQGGIKADQDADQLMEDLKLKKIDICCLQETKREERLDVDNSRGTLITMRHDQPSYGQGFYFSERLKAHYWGHKYVSDRISTIEFRLDQKRKNKRLTKLGIINVYGPTSQVAQQQPAAADTYFRQLGETVKRMRKECQLFLIMGDFNAKLGLRASGEEFMGNFGKGTRNDNGRKLADFLGEEQLKAVNTMFEHKNSRRSTWHGTIQGKNIHNQIDYIVTRQAQACMFRNARAHNSQHFDSDHSLVIGVLETKKFYARRKKTAMVRRVDFQALQQDEQLKQKYQHEVAKNLQNGSTKNEYNRMVDALQEASLAIPEKPKLVNGRLIFDDDTEIKRLKTLKCNKRNSLTRCESRARRSEILKELKEIRRWIKMRTTTLLNTFYTRMADEVQTYKHKQRAYEAFRHAQKQRHAQLQLMTADGKESTNPSALLPLVSEFYDSFFNQQGMEPVERWMPDDNMRPLQNPITTAETKKARQLLRNNRTCGKDGIYGEHLKYCGDEMDQTMADMYNKIFSERAEVAALCEGILIPLNKPGKERIAKNTRPITLLNMVRKTLAMIVLRRIQPFVTAYMPKTQCGFQPNRSATEVVWTYRWMTSCAEKYDKEFSIMGIDMSKAFDSINRELLLKILKDIIPEDELRIIRYLLSETTLEAKIEGKYGDKIKTTIGTPQGDALSPVLFIVYLEAAMRNYRKAVEDTRIFFANRGQDPYPSAFEMETAYADDVDFIKTNRLAHTPTEQFIEPALADANLQVNGAKTEYIQIKRGEIIRQKKLGSKIDASEDIKYRIQQSQRAFNINMKMWKSRRLSMETKIRMYNAFIYPHLTYNIGASAGRRTDWDKMDAHHRRHLRMITGCFFKVKKIHNVELYALTKSHPISVIASQQRVRLLGHILRQHPDAPGKRIMTEYFIDMPGRTGRKTTLVSKLQDDLRKANIPFKTRRDYEQVHQIAQDRTRWRAVVNTVFTTSNAFETERQNSLAMKRRGTTRSRGIISATTDIQTATGRRQRVRITTQEPVILRIRRSDMIIDE